MVNVVWRMNFCRPLLSLGCGGLALGAWVAVATPVLAQKKAERDAAPILISKDGPAWRNDAELRRHAELGNPQAQFEWGERLLNGDGVDRDFAQARALLEKAAQAGVAEASFRLGKIHHDGLGVPRSLARGFTYYAEAARRGVPEAQHNLGAMLVSARGVRRDYVEGLAWLIVATKSGAVSTAEQQTRERLAKRPNDIAQAEQRAKELLSALRDPNNDVEPRVTFAGSTPVEPPRGARSGVSAPTREPPPKVEVTAPAKIEPPKPALSPPKVEVAKPKVELPKSEPGTR